MSWALLVLTSFFIFNSEREILSPEIQSLIVKKLGAEIVRLDGEGLLARQERRMNFQEVVQSSAELI